MSDEFWTPEEDAEFATAELDDAAASQAAEDQFPTGWTEVGATDEPITLGTGTMIGPARIFTAPVESPIFEAVDRASADRTPIADVTISAPKLGSLLPGLMEGFAEMAKSFTKTIENVGVTLETIRELYEGLAPPVTRKVALMGTGYRRHAVPRKQRPGESRAAHARRRRLYSERLRRDRRRRRAGRAPILRSSAFQMLIPRAQLDVTKAGPELTEMEIVLSTAVPPDQVYSVDHSALAGERFVEPYELQPPILFDTAAAERRASWRREWMGTLGLYGSLTGRTHRATNYLIQADAAAREDARIEGYKPSRMWVDDVEVDVDTWMNEGGAE